MMITDLEKTTGCGHRHIRLQRENVLSPCVYEQEFLCAWVLKKKDFSNISHMTAWKTKRFMGYGKR